tara:strand:+ start:22606 stop:23208 length:603 start_codon:yes stop_codon:yes gene_type:complete
MRILILATVILFGWGASAQGLYDNLSSGQKLMLEIQFRLGVGKKTKSRKVSPKQIKKRCMESIGYSVAGWKKYQKEGFPFVETYVLEDSFTKEEIEKSETVPSYEPWRNADMDYVPGLANDRKIGLAYTYMTSAPHTRPACKDQWLVKEIQLVTIKEKSCRRVKIELYDYEYGVTFCEGDKAVLLDYNKDEPTQVACANN